MTHPRWPGINLLKVKTAPDDESDVCRSETRHRGRTASRRMGGARAFSLIELSCVIAIIAVVAAIGLPHWAAASQTYALNLATQRLVRDLQYAQARANYGSAAVTVSFTPSSSSYQIVGMADPDRPAQTYTVNLAADPYRATITSAAFGASTSPSTQLTFDGFGTPTAGGAVVVSVGGKTRTVSVDATSGSITSQ